MPVIVNIPPEKEPVRPAGKAPADKTAPVAPPPIVYSISIIGEPIQIIWVLVNGAEVNTKVCSITSMVPDKETALHAPPTVSTV